MDVSSLTPHEALMPRAEAAWPMPQGRLAPTECQWGGGLAPRRRRRFDLRVPPRKQFAADVTGAVGPDRVPVAATLAPRRRCRPFDGSGWGLWQNVHVHAHAQENRCCSHRGWWRRRHLGIIGVLVWRYRRRSWLRVAIHRGGATIPARHGEPPNGLGVPHFGGARMVLSKTCCHERADGRRSELQLANRFEPGGALARA